jgi:hypothetical protein
MAVVVIRLPGDGGFCKSYSQSPKESIANKNISLQMWKIFIVCILLCHDVFFFGQQQIYQNLNQSNVTVLHWFYVVTAICSDAGDGSRAV